MPLLIHLNDANAPAHREATTHLFGPAGGRIGRSPECELVLRDPEAYVSNLHASIARRGERWIAVDHSTNGIVLNDAREPLPAGHALTWGIITQGTCLEGSSYTPPPPIRVRRRHQNDGNANLNAGET